MESALDQIAHLVGPVELALDCHLSIAWRLGMFLDSKSGLQVAIRQKRLGLGTEVWTAASAPVPATWGISDAAGQAADVVVSVSVTHDVAPDVQRSVAALGLAGARRIDLFVPAVSASAIRDGTHASALADALVAQIRQLVPDGGHHLHLFMAAPVSFVFLFGQRATALGPTTVYEFDFGNTRAYSPGLSTWRP